LQFKIFVGFGYLGRKKINRTDLDDNEDSGLMTSQTDAKLAYKTTRLYLQSLSYSVKTEPDGFK